LLGFSIFANTENYTKFMMVICGKVKIESYIAAILFLLIPGVTVLICERLGFNDKKFNLTFGIALVAAGIIVDLTM
jgi:hypothetical protein